jgi:carbon-monoxide dehydrogenase medium subunit
MIARTLGDAVAALADHGEDGAPVAGATWIMRAPLRAEPMKRHLVALGAIDGMRAIDIAADAISIGACVTHAALADALAALPDMHVLAQAAGLSANPAVRAMATLGGNLCTSAFPAADLVPALMCLDALVDLASPRGDERLPLTDFLVRRPVLPPGTLVCRVVVPRAQRCSAHARLPLRKAGDYPVAIVSVALALSGGRIAKAGVAVGSVEAVARRWSSLEARLVGQAPDPEAAAQAARDGMDFIGRDGVEAPGWYRESVLPTLVKRALQSLRP